MPNLYVRQADGTLIKVFRLYGDFVVRSEAEEVSVLGARPLPVEVTDEMVERAQRILGSAYSDETVRHALTLALCAAPGGGEER